VGDGAGAVGQALSLLRCVWRAGNAQAGRRGAVSPFSSSFFVGRLLNCLHHEVRSRLAEAGSGVCRAMGCGSAWRARGVWAWACVPGMASELESVAALQWVVFAGCERLRCGAVRCEGAVSRCSRGQEWVGGRRTGPRRHTRTRGTGRWGQGHGVRGECCCAGEREGGGGGVLSDAGAGGGWA
jgi:hypothetical protein